MASKQFPSIKKGPKQAPNKPKQAPAGKPMPFPPKKKGC
jgi:hypothetical protein